MKKIFLVLLVIAIVFSMAVPTVVQAQATAKENTYIASDVVYSNSYGKVFVEREWIHPDDSNPNLVSVVSNLIYEDASGTRFLAKRFFDDKDEAPYLSFYVRGKTIFYAVSGAENVVDGMYSMKFDGDQEGPLLRETAVLIGGYGTMPIIKIGKNLYKVSNGKKSKIATLANNNSGIVLFNGKLYFENKAYNIDTGKTKTFTIKTAVATKDYMYYITGVDNLVMYDKQDNKTYLAKKVYDVLGGNDNKNVVFAKKSSKGEVTFYRSSSTNKIYTLATYKQLLKVAKVESEINSYELSGVSAKFVNGKVVFLVKDYECYFAQLKNTGGTLKFVKAYERFSTSSRNYNRPVFEAVGKKIYFKYRDNEGEATFYNTLDF